jgi:hypothetical protein
MSTLHEISQHGCDTSWRNKRRRTRCVLVTRLMVETIALFFGIAAAALAVVTPLVVGVAWAIKALRL